MRDARLWITPELPPSVGLCHDSTRKTVPRANTRARACAQCAKWRAPVRYSVTPALAAADIGIAMGGGTDVALETADAAILHGRVMDVVKMVELSKATMRNIHQNITIALGLKAVFLVTTVLGITGLWPAILADTGATVLVTANALRLLNFKNSTNIATDRPRFRVPTRSERF